MRKTESFLQCVRCSRTYDIGQLRYTCDCGGVLDVKRDFLETIARCRQITPADCEASGLRRMAREVLRIFAPLM